MAQRERSLEIAIRAKDDYSKKLEQAKRQHTDFRQFVEKNAASRTGLSTAADEARELREAYAKATKQAREYGDVVRKLSTQGSLTAEEAENLSAHGHAVAMATAKAKGYRDELKKRQEVVRALAEEEAKLNAAIEAGERRRAYLTSGRNSGEGLRSESSYINRVRTDGDVQPMQTDKALALREVVRGRMALRDARAEQEAYRASLEKLKMAGDGFEAEIRQMQAALATADTMVDRANRNLNERLRVLNVVKASEAAAATKAREHAEAQEREAAAAARVEAALEKANAARRATAQTPAVRGDERAYKNAPPAPVIVQDNAKMSALRGVVEARRNADGTAQAVGVLTKELRDLTNSGVATEAQIKALSTQLDRARKEADAARSALADKTAALRGIRAAEAEAAQAAREMAEAQDREAAAAARAEAALEKANAARLAAAQTPAVRGDERAYKNAPPAPVVVQDNAKMAALRGVVDARRDVEATTKAVGILANELRELRASGGATEAQIKQLSTAFERAKDEARNAKAALAEKSAALQQVRNAEALAAAEARKHAEAQEATVVKLRRVSGGAESSQVQQRRLAQAIRGTTDEMRKQAKVAGDAARKELAEYQASLEGATGGNAQMRGGLVNRIIGAWGTQQGRGPLGLRPYELTNLSYQINDVVSGLAMGQAPMQIFAQQAGQIIQIFPSMAASILRMAPALAILAPFAIALNRIGQESKLLNEIQRQLDLMATGASYSARELKEMTGRLDDAGASLKDAKAAMDSFLGARLDGELFDNLGNAALNLSKLEGTKLPEAAEKIAEAFKGGVDGVRELDTQMGFLTAQQYETMRALAATGNEAEALRIAADALDDRLSEVAGATEGWAAAVAALGGAWDALMSRLAQNDILQAVAAGFSDLGDAVAALLEDFENLIALPEVQVPDVQIDITMSDAQLEQEIENARNMVEAGMRIPIPDAMLTWLGLEDMVEAEAYFNERLRLLEEESRRRQQIAQDADNQAKLEQDIQAIVDETVESLAKQVEQSQLTSREREIQKALDEAREAAQKRAIELGIQFLGLTQQQTAALREQVGLMWDMQNATSIPGLGGAKDGVEAAAALLRDSEGFRNTPYWDVNAFRVGYGSDTITLSDGTIQKVTKGMSVSVEDANRDLMRRITTEFMPKARSAVGGDRFDKLLPEQQAVLTSLAYNFGSLPKSVAAAVRDGLSASEVADRIKALGAGSHAGTDIGEGLISRRNKEATIYASGMGEQGALRRQSQAQEEAARAAERAAEAERRKAEQAERFRRTQDENLGLQELEISLAGQAAGEKAAQLAVAQAEIAARRAGVELTAEEKARIAEVARQKAELAEASKAGSKADKERTEQLKKAKVLEQEVTRLKERQKFLQEERTYAMDRGDSETIAKIDSELESVNSELDAAIQKAIAFWQALGGDGAAAAIQKLEQTRVQMGRMGEQSVVTAEQMNELFAGAILNGLDAFARGLAEGQSASEAFGQAFRQMASQILIEIGKIILKAAIMRMLMSIFPGLGGLGGAVAGGINGMFFHDGGVVGSGGRSKQVPVSAFLGATRYHSGGIAGLEANEVAAVLKDGEEVLTEGDPRHRNNMGAGGDGTGGRSGTPPLRIMNVLQGSEVMKAALAESGGSELMLNFISANKDEIKAMLGN